MALAARQPIVRLGTTPAYAAPLASENIIPAKGLFLHVINTNGSPCVVTPDDPGVTPAGSAAVDPGVTVPATTGQKLIPLPLELVNPSTGFITVTFSIQASVTAGLFQLLPDD